MKDKNLDKIFKNAGKVKSTFSLSKVKKLIDYRVAVLKQNLLTYSLNSILIAGLVTGAYFLLKDAENQSEINKTNKEISFAEKKEVEIKKPVEENKQQQKANYQPVNVKENEPSHIEEVKNSVELKSTPNNEKIPADTGFAVNQKSKPKQKTASKTDSIATEKTAIKSEKTEKKEADLKYVLNSEVSENEFNEFIDMLKNQGVKINIKKTKFNKKELQKFHFTIGDDLDQQAENFDKILFIFTGDIDKRVQIIVMNK